MYCVNCGVELAEHQRTCPLCGTPVVLPPTMKIEKAKREKQPYPQDNPLDSELMPNEINRVGIQFVFLVIFLVPMLLTVICDLSINKGIVWSGYCVGALALAYICFVLPFWFVSPNPVIFVPADFVALAGYVLYISLSLGQSWFLPFAMPLLLMAAAITTAVVVLLRYVPKGALYTLGGASILLGIMLFFAEILIKVNFYPERGIIWSIYPLTVFILLGAMLLIIAICRPIRESLRKKFFI